MKDEFKAGDFVRIKGKKETPLLYMVVNPVVEGVSPNVGGMTLVARWYRTDLLTKEMNSDT
jgi:hypothetical protein